MISHNDRSTTDKHELLSMILDYINEFDLKAGDHVSRGCVWVDDDRIDWDFLQLVELSQDGYLTSQLGWMNGESFYLTQKAIDASRANGVTLLRVYYDYSKGHNRLTVYKTFRGTYLINSKHYAANLFSGWNLWSNESPTAKDAYKSVFSKVRQTIATIEGITQNDA